MDGSVPTVRASPDTTNGANVSRLRTTTLLAGLLLALAACSQGNVFELSVGDCFDDTDLAAEEVSDVPVVECSEPHDNEIYHAFDLADGDYPGEEEVETKADDGCLAAFDAFVGTPYLDSQLEYFAIYPTEQSWTEVDDREVLCAVYDMSLEKLTGTVGGSGR